MVVYSAFSLFLGTHVHISDIRIQRTTGGQEHIQIAGVGHHSQPLDLKNMI